MSLNKAMLIGRAGRDPEIRYADFGDGRMKTATFTLATDEPYRDRRGNVREHVEWHRIIAWNQIADLVERQVRKGVLLYIEGRIRTRVWTDRAGNDNKVTEIAADVVRILGGLSERGTGQTADASDAHQAGSLPGRTAAQDTASGQTPGNQPDAETAEAEDDGLPF